MQRGENTPVDVSVLTSTSLDRANAEVGTTPRALGTLFITVPDVDWFRHASGDHNPLHTSQEYARKTPFGEPPVFGVLGILLTLGALPRRDGELLRRVFAEFRNPLYVGVRYTLETKAKSDHELTIRLLDSGRLMTAIALEFGAGICAGGDLAQAGDPEILRATDLAIENIAEKFSVAGSYVPLDVSTTMTRYGLVGKGVGAAQVAALLWSSYLVGMELPGKRALFWRLSMQFEPPPVRHQGRLRYQARVDKIDRRVDLLELSGSLASANGIIANASISAFVRAESPAPSWRSIDKLIPRSEALRGKVALVIGGSRGLGASIGTALALQGGTVVINFLHSRSEAEKLQHGLGAVPGQIELLRGNATDPTWCQALKEHVVEKYGGLDLLVCNACPPIRPLGFGQDSSLRFHEFVNRALQLVETPMSTLIGSLAQRRGWCVAISSSFVHSVPPEWPHYVTAKAAVEGLVHWAAEQYRQVQFLVLRPPKLLTDQTNTPLGRNGAQSADQVAAKLTARLCQPPSGERPEFLSEF